MQIRPFQDRDTDAIITLWKQCDLLQSTEEAHAYIKKKVDFQPEMLLVGERQGAIAATVMAGYEGRRGWINLLAVHPDHQRQGLGRQIMEAAETRLQSIGCPKINLQVRTRNEQVIDFYKHLGYTVDACVSMGKRMG